MPAEAVAVAAEFVTEGAPSDAATVQVADFAAFQEAISSATGDIVLDLTQDVLTDSSTAYAIQSDYAVTITSSNGSKLILNNKALSIYSRVIFQNITIEERGGNSNLYIRNDGEGHAGNVDVDNVTFVAGLRTDNGETSTSVRYFIYLLNADLTIYGMTADAVKDATKNAALFLAGTGTVTFKPTGDITIPTIYQTESLTNGFQIVPQNGCTITAASFDGTDITDALSNGTYTVPAVTQAIKYSAGLSITVSSGSPGTTYYPVTIASLENGAITADRTTAAVGAPITLTVAPSAGYQLKADSLTVTKAGGGTVAVTKQTDSTYTFIMPAEAVTVTAEFTVPFTVATPTFSVAAGTVAVNTQVTISSETTGASIYYTTDGTTPSAANGTLYSGPVSISADMTLKAVAVLDGYPASEVATAAYTVATEKYDIYIQGQNYTYSLWADHTALAEGAVKSSSGNTEYTKAALPGQTVEFTVTPLDGYEITQLNVTWTLYMQGGAVETAYDQTTGRYSFTMPVGWVSIRPDTSAVKKVTVAEGIAGGTVTTDAVTTSGSVTVTATPDPGNHLKSIFYSYDDGATWTQVASGQTTFTPTADVTVKAEFAEGVDISISSAEQLAAFAAAVNAGDAYIGATLTLTDDIALTGEWTPIGADFPFAGTFDGNHRTVSGLLITQGGRTYAGLFGRAGTIQNLTVAGTISCAGADGSNTMYVGGVAGSAGTLTNCTSVVDISMGRGCVGGVAGTARSITGCRNYGTLTIAVSDGQEALDVGGIVGTTQTGASMDRCANYGGIIFDGGVYSVTDSHTGVTTTGDAASGYFGGLVGGTGIPEITNSANKGTISGDMRTAGGLVGEASAALTLTNCYNTGAVTEMGDYLNQSRVRLGGLVGSSYYNRYNLTLNNCYSTGAVTVQQPTSRAAVGELHCNAIDNGAHGGGTATTTVNNSFGPSSLSNITADQLGSAFKEDTQNVNGGKPLLTWEDSEPSSETYDVIFSVTPANALVTVYTDADMLQPVEKGADGYALQMSTYYYKATAAGYGTETGSFTVSNRPVTVTVALRQVVTVTFQVTPSDAGFRLTDSGGGEITPTSSTQGVYSFDLYIGNVYIYTATKDGYNGTTREYNAGDGGSVTVNLTPSGQSGDNPTIKGGQTISAGGIYNLARNDGATQGTITISTADPVTLVGAGVSLSEAYGNLYLDCTTAGVKLTLQDLYISNTVGAANMIDFMGADNYLYFSGVSILDMNTGATGYAMLHVGQDAELTIGGVTPEDTLYFYKREQGAGIGGNQGEYNGKVTITGGNLFMKNSKQGALIGSGANAKSAPGSPGDIIIEDGILNLIPISRGAAIGGSAGNAGGATGTNVYIQGGTLTINVDYSGSAIGGGGFAEGNDSDGGILHYSGGSIRTFIDHNAAASNLWPGVTTAGVNDVAVTADKRNAEGETVYLLTFDTSRLSTPADGFTVEEGGVTLYSGGLHTWRYINEDLYKTDQIPINYTIDNWASLNDPNLYLYLTGGDHTLTVNGEDFVIKWNSAALTFTVEGAGQGETPPTLIADTMDNTVGQAAEITFTDDGAWRNAISGITVNGSALTGGQYTVSAGAINIDAGVFTAAGDYSITVTASGYTDATVTQAINEAPVPGDNPKYTVAPKEDVSVYEVGETGGISTMTVKTGVSGLKYFGAQLTPVRAHEGLEAVIFVHLRDGVQLSLNITKADFDVVDEAQAGFNVQAGDIVKVFIVDDLTNDVNHNPVLLQ